MSPETLEAPVVNGVDHGIANGAVPVHNTSAPRLREVTKPKRVEGKPSWQVVLLTVDTIAPSPYQPRQTFSEDEMEELVASVREHGVQQPILVRSTPQPKGDTTELSKDLLPYQLVAGERRLRASKTAKRRLIPAIIRDDLTDAEAAELALLENVQRSNLTVMEEAIAYKRLLLEFRMKEERIAKKVGKSVQVVRDTLKLLTLPPGVRMLLASKKLTATHGQVLLRLVPFETICTLVAQKVATDTITATALSQNILPNSRELLNKKLIVQLDFRTKFDWRSVCGNCPYKAYVAGDFSSYCLKPDEWQRKQTEAIELQKQEASRILEEAKSRESNEVNVEMLPPGSFRDLSFGQIPAGCCETCPCRNSSPDPRDATKKRPICLNPERFVELQKAERQAHEEARKRHFTALWRDAKMRLGEEINLGQTKRSLILALWPVLTGEHLRYGGADTWHALTNQVAHEIGIEWPKSLQNEEATPAQVITDLEALESRDLIWFIACLLLGFEALVAVRYGSEIPLLSAVLGLQDPIQPELEESESEEESSPDLLEE
jgi:ParB/RepB/Spo0J family partition protein